jgi:hypothetical protein
MPTRTDKGHTEKQGSGTGGGQKATSGMTRTPGATAPATENRDDSDNGGRESR